MHQWSTIPLDNQTADPRADWHEGQPASSLNNAGRGMMATVALWRDDNLGVALVAVPGAGNVYAVTTGQGLIDPETVGTTPAITHPFSLRLTFMTAPAGLATNPLKLAIDGGAPAAVVRADGSALVDGDIGTTRSYQIVGYAFTAGALSQIRIGEMVQGDVTALAMAAITATVPPLIAALGTPLQKTGDTMTGDLTLAKTVPRIFMDNTNVNKWALTVENDGGLSFWGSSAGQRKVEFGNDGSITTLQFGDLNTRIETRAQAWAVDRAVAYTNTCVQGARFILAGDLFNSWNLGGGFGSPFGGYACIVDRATIADGTANGAWIPAVFRWRYLQVFIPNQGWVTVGAVS